MLGKVQGAGQGEGGRCRGRLCKTQVAGWPVSTFCSRLYWLLGAAGHPRASPRELPLFIVKI